MFFVRIFNKIMYLCIAFRESNGFSDRCKRHYMGKSFTTSS